MIKWIFIITLIALCSSCAQIDTQPDPKVVKPQNSVFEEVPTVEIQPGMVKVVEFYMPEEYKGGTFFCKKKIVKHQEKNDRAIAFLSESYFSDLTKYNCELGHPDVEKKRVVLKVTVSPYQYPEEKFNVDKKRVDLSKKNLNRVIRENEMLKRIYSGSNSTAFFEVPFLKPLNSKITSKFGSRRVFNNKRKTQHLGTDYRARTGVRIKTSNRGKVVFAGNLFFGGNTVIIDHGIGVFTSYSHLSKILTSTGSFVPQGHIIGLSGATGRVSGPHLHWGVKVQGNSVDGNSLVNESTRIFSAGQAFLQIPEEN